LLFLVGIPISFFATGLRLQPLVRSTSTGAIGLWSGVRFVGRIFSRSHSADEEDDEFDDTLEPSLDVAPEPVAAATGDLRETRVRREQARKVPARPKSASQPALNLGEGEYQLPALGLLAEPIRTQGRAGQSDEALEENAR